MCAVSGWRCDAWRGGNSIRKHKRTTAVYFPAFNAKNVVKGNKMLELQSIERVHNNTLEQRFVEKKTQYEQTYGQVRVVKGWHGTKQVNVAPILKNNFDVSKHGQGVGESWLQ